MSTLNSPLFSIITPSRNQIEWLYLCISSVRQQIEMKASALLERKNGSWRKDDPGIKHNHDRAKKFLCSRSEFNQLTLEHIIQDSGSPGIEKLAQEVGAYFYRDGNLVFSPNENLRSISGYRISIHCESDSGMYDAINRGFCKAKGNILAWLNCDEQYLPNALAVVAQHFALQRSLDYLVGGAIILNDKFTYNCTRLPPKAFISQLWHGELPYLSCASFFRSSSINGLRTPFCKSFKTAADLLLFMKLIRAHARGKWIKNILSVFADHGKNLNLTLKAQKEIKAITRYAPKYSTILLPLVRALYRIRKLLHGSYRPPIIDVTIYCKLGERKRIYYTSAQWRWKTYNIRA